MIEEVLGFEEYEAYEEFEEDFNAPWAEKSWWGNNAKYIKNDNLPCVDSDEWLNS